MPVLLLGIKVRNNSVSTTCTTTGSMMISTRSITSSCIFPHTHWSECTFVSMLIGSREVSPVEVVCPYRKPKRPQQVQEVLRGSRQSSPANRPRQRETKSWSGEAGTRVPLYWNWLRMMAAWSAKLHLAEPIAWYWLQAERFSRGRQVQSSLLFMNSFATDCVCCLPFAKAWLVVITCKIKPHCKPWKRDCHPSQYWLLLKKARPFEEAKYFGWRTTGSLSWQKFNVTAIFTWTDRTVSLHLWSHSFCITPSAYVSSRQNLAVSISCRPDKLQPLLSPPLYQHPQQQQV